MEFGFTSVAAITVICLLLCQALKAVGVGEKWMPVAAMLLGGVLGVCAWYVMPEYPAQDILTAIAVGIVSGGAATGAHQVFKQAGK